MTKKKHKGREAPCQFRVGLELRQQILTFAARNQLHVNVACKFLVALAMTEMDCRYYSMVTQMANLFSTRADGFVQCCLHIQAAIRGALRERGEASFSESDRCAFIQATARDFLASKGYSGAKVSVTI